MILRNNNLSMSELGDRLKKIMVDRNVNQVELAKKSGVDQSYISELRDGKKNNPSHKIVIVLCEALKCNPHQLTGDPFYENLDMKKIRLFAKALGREPEDFADLEITPAVESLMNGLVELADEARAVSEAYKKLQLDDWRRKAIKDILRKELKERESDSPDSKTNIDKMEEE